MSSLAQWCFRHRKVVLALWLLALIGIGGAAQAAKSDYSTNFTLKNTQSVHALNILEANSKKTSGDLDQIVLQAKTGKITSPAIASEIKAVLIKVSKKPHVSEIVSPIKFASPALAYSPGQVSPNGTIAFATIHFDQQATTLPVSAVNAVIATAEAARSPQLNVQLSGQAIEAAQPEKSSDSTGLGIVFALIILGLVFGALFAAVLPILTTLFAIGIGYSLTSLLSHTFAIASFVPILGLLIGLGVGVDYALFILTRHRNGLRAGRSVEDAAVTALDTSGRAVFFAGLTVCIALLGQFTLGLNFLYGLAVASALTVLLTMAASLTLLPAMLGFVGLRALSRRERRKLAAEGPVSENVTGGFWYRRSRLVQARPALLTGAAFLVVVVIALPIFTLRLGLDDAGSDPTSSTTRQAYDLVATGFGPGFNGPLQLVATIDSPTEFAQFQHVVKEVAAQPGVKFTPPAAMTPNGKAAAAFVYPDYAPQAAQTSTLLHHLRNEVIPEAEAGTGIHVLVGGATALQDDFASTLSSKLWLFIVVVVALAFLLLMTVFRSLLIPAIASVMNLLSVGAALGIMNAVFEWGWGASLFGITRTLPVEVFIPSIMFSILFGLSMDYEVFLVSRMHEEWLHSGDNRRAVTQGQTETGRVITAAALIMVLVFLSFLLGGSSIIDQFGIGLSGAILIDAFVVRTVLVPALMHLTGPANWWLPGWLDRALPRVNVEGTVDPVPGVGATELVS
jgi:RND superfamily putative drug exporter